MLQLSPAEKEREKSLSLLRKLQSLIRVCLEDFISRFKYHETPPYCFPNLFQDSRSSVTLESQNKIYKTSDVILRKEYETTIKSTYNTEVESLDFSKPDQASNAINEWVKSATHGLIPTIVEKGYGHKYSRKNSVSFFINIEIYYRKHSSEHNATSVQLYLLER